jgi:hypothetical protein
LEQAKSSKSTTTNKQLKFNLHMKTNSRKHLFLASAVLLAFVGTASAIVPSSITGVARGTAAPPTTLGGFSLSPFAPDLSPDGNDVTAIGALTFNQTVGSALI